MSRITGSTSPSNPDVQLSPHPAPKCFVLLNACNGGNLRVILLGCSSSSYCGFRLYGEDVSRLRGGILDHMRRIYGFVS